MPKSNQTSGSDLIPDDITTWFNARWDGNMGAIDGHDVRFIASLLAEVKPKTIVEIGCASGLSTSMISMMQSRQGPSTLHSFDFLDHFYANPEKKLGYLLDESGPSEGVDIQIHSKSNSLDVGDALNGTSIDFCFIDANHTHPWPTIDTLAVLPLMRPGSYIVHHDLRMFEGSQVDEYATGPKVLMDQTPRRKLIPFQSRVNTHKKTRMHTRQIDENIFAIRIPRDISTMAKMLSRGFLIGWDRRPNAYLGPEFVQQFQSYLSEHYNPEIRKSFELGLARYNHQPTPRSPLRRILGKLKRMVSA